MIRRSAIIKLPPDVREILNGKLRIAACGDYATLTDRLLSIGHETRKSALHRYGKALKRVDAENGIQVAQVAEEMSVLSGSGDTQRSRLLLELGRVRYEEVRILARLAELDAGTA